MLWSADAMGSCPPEIEVSLKRGLFTRGLGMRGVVQPHIGCGSPAPAGNNVEFHNLLFPRLLVDIMKPSASSARLKRGSSSLATGAQT